MSATCWTAADLQALADEIADLTRDIDRLTAVEPVSREAGVARDDTVARARRGLARLEQLQAEVNPEEEVA